MTSDIFLLVRDNYCKRLGKYSTDTVHNGASFTVEVRFLECILTLSNAWTDFGEAFLKSSCTNG